MKRLIYFIAVIFFALSSEVAISQDGTIKKPHKVIKKESVNNNTRRKIGKNNGTKKPVKRYTDYVYVDSVAYDACVDTVVEYGIDDDFLWEDESYIKIIDIGAENSDTNGNTIIAHYCEDMRYLKPKLEIESHTSVSRNITLYYKIFMPDGTLWRNYNSSPEGYTWYDIVNIEPNTTEISLCGWGNNDQSLYSEGDYRVEVYSEKGILLGSETFSIESKKAGKIESCNIEHNIMESGVKSMKIHCKVTSEGYKDYKLTLKLRFFRGEYEYTTTKTLTSTYESSVWNDLIFTIPNSTLSDRFGSSKGSTVNYELILSDDNGKVLDKKTDMSIRWS